MNIISRAQGSTNLSVQNVPIKKPTHLLKILQAWLTLLQIAPFKVILSQIVQDKKNNLTRHYTTHNNIQETNSKIEMSGVSY